jgi:OmpA-OmpF porin, OOP family
MSRTRNRCLVALACALALATAACETVAPEAKKQESQVPEQITLPGAMASAPALPEDVWQRIPRSPEDVPVKILSATWQATSGINAAIGGTTPAPDSLVAKAGLTKVSLQIQNDMNALGPAMVAGAENPANGAQFIWYTGDSWAQAAGQINEQLAKYGDKAVVVMSGGFSDGEDCFMGPAEWKADPAKAKGSVVVAQLRGCDFNVVLKWAGDNKVPVNPDVETYDPDAINFEDATDHIVAAQKFVSNQQVTRKDKKTGQQVTKPLTGVGTWTPGDVTVVQKKPGTIKIASTKEYATMMPHLFIGSQKWMNAHRDATKTLLSCFLASCDLIKSNEQYRKYAMQVNATVFNEADKDATYWEKYFPGAAETSGTANVTLGGSRVNNLEDNLNLFGLKGGTNYFAETYEAFGRHTVKLYPTVLPSFPPAKDVVDTSFLQEIAASVQQG